MPSTAHEPALPITPVRMYSREDRARRVGQHELERRAAPRGSSATGRSSCPPSRRRPRSRRRRGPSAAQISGPVPVSCASGLAGLPNWLAKNAPGISRASARRHVLVVLGMALADVRARDVHLGAQRLQVQHLLGRHLVGHDQHHAVALRARDQRQARGRCCRRSPRPRCRRASAGRRARRPRSSRGRCGP